MAASTPQSAPSLDIIEEPSDDAASHRACDDEPPAAERTLHSERDRAGNQPGQAAPWSAPERDQHGSKEHRHHQIDTVAARICDQRAGKMTGNRSAHPGECEHRGRAEEDADVTAALGAISHRDDPARIDGEMQRRIDFPWW